jgi:hypothetical protein
MKRQSWRIVKKPSKRDAQKRCRTNQPDISGHVPTASKPSEVATSQGLFRLTLSRRGKVALCSM